MVSLRPFAPRHWIVISSLIAALAIFVGLSVPSALEATKGNFSVMTYNIWDLDGKRPELEDVSKVIKSEGVPDILLLQEVQGGEMADFLSSTLGLTYSLYHQAVGQKYGLAILSRYPFQESGFLYFKSSKIGRGILKAVIACKSGKVSVCSVHLDRIDSVKVNQHGIMLSWGGALQMLVHEMVDETVRSRSVEELLDWVGSERVIIGGDFNTVFCSKAIRKMGTVFNDVLSFSLDYFRGSYLRSGFPLGPRLDFLFHSKDLECMGAFVVGQTAGDHYPVRAEFGF